MSLDPTTTTAPEAGSPEDPFRLGWRYRMVTHPDGTTESVQIPLTPYDLLFPEEGDFVVQNEQHIEDCFYLYYALRTAVAGIPGGIVLSDHRVQFDVPDLKALGPDVAVFFDADRSTKPATLDVATTGARSILMVEVTSPDTSANDLGIKREFYHQAQSEYYVVIDPVIRGDVRRSVRLLGYRYAPDDFEPVPLDEQGRLWIEPLNLWMIVHTDLQVRCIDGRSGRLIESPPENHAARIAAEEQMRAEATARIAAEEQMRAEATARIAAEEQMRAETTARIAAEEQMRRAEEQMRRAEEQARAETEAKLQMAARMVALEAELRRLQGEAEG